MDIAPAEFIDGIVILRSTEVGLRGGAIGTEGSSASHETRHGNAVRRTENSQLIL